MKKKYIKLFTSFAALAITIPMFNSVGIVTNAETTDGYINLSDQDSKDKVNVYYINESKNISLIKHPNLMANQLTKNEQELFSISSGNLLESLPKIKDYITSPSGLIKNLRVSSKNSDVSIKSVASILTDDDLKNVSFTNGFNMQVLVRLSNFEELTFSIPVAISDDNGSTPTLQLDPVFLIRPTLYTSQEGFSLVNGISARYNYQNKSFVIPTKEWKITSTNGIIKNDNVLDISQPGTYRVDYEVTNPILHETAKLSRTITVVDKSDSNEDYTPIYQPTLYPVNKVGYVDYKAGYGIMLYDDFGDDAKPLNRYLPHGSSWKVINSVFDEHGEVWYSLGKDQWVKQKYITFSTSVEPVNFVVQISAEKGCKLYNGYGSLAVFSGRVLNKNSKWKVKSKVLSDDSLWYNLGRDQWIKADDAISLSN